MATMDDVREIFAEHRKNDDRIKALVEYIDNLVDGDLYMDTGIPGHVVSTDELAPGVTVGRNANGSIVDVEVRQ